MHSDRPRSLFGIDDLIERRWFDLGAAGVPLPLLEVLVLPAEEPAQSHADQHNRADRDYASDEYHGLSLPMFKKTLKLFVDSPLFDSWGRVSAQFFYASVTLCVASVIALIAVVFPTSDNDANLVSAIAGFAGGLLIAGSVLSILVRALVSIAGGAFAVAVALVIAVQYSSGAAYVVLGALFVIAVLMVTAIQARQRGKGNLPGAEGSGEDESNGPSPAPPAEPARGYAFLGVTILFYGLAVQIAARYLY